MQEGIDSSLHKLFKLFVFGEFWEHCQRPNAKIWEILVDFVIRVELKVAILLKSVKKCKVFVLILSKFT